jgi:hypothetical protein
MPIRSTWYTRARAPTSETQDAALDDIQSWQKAWDVRPGLAFRVPVQLGVDC